MDLLIIAGLVTGLGVWLTATASEPAAARALTPVAVADVASRQLK